MYISNQETFDPKYNIMRVEFIGVTIIGKSGRVEEYDDWKGLFTADVMPTSANPYGYLLYKDIANLKVDVPEPPTSLMFISALCGFILCSVRNSNKDV